MGSPVNTAVQRIIQAFQAGDAARQADIENRLRQQQIEAAIESLRQSRELFPFLRQQAQFGALGERAGLLGATEQGGALDTGDLGLGQLQIPGIARTAEIGVETAGKRAKAITAGEIAAKREAFNAIQQDEIDAAAKRLEAAGIKPDNPLHDKLQARLLGIPEVVDLGAATGIKELEGVTGTAKEFLDYKKTIEAAKIRGQTSITVAGLRGGRSGGGLSPAQETALADMRILRNEFQSSLDNLEQVKGSLGPFRSRLKAIGLSTGTSTDPTFTRFFVQINQLRNKLLKVRSGSAVTDNELRRIATELPTLGVLQSDDLETIRIKLEQGLADLDAALQIFEETAGGAVSPNINIRLPQDVGKEIEDFPLPEPR